MPSMQQCTRYICLTLVCILTGCGGGDRPGAVLRDSAGIQIVENAAPDSARATWWRLAVPPVLDIGVVEGTEAETLFRVTDAKRLSDGRLVVANSGSLQVRFYAADGTLDTISGKQGSGPGEFQRITELTVLPGDSIGVFDSAARRITVLDPQGRFVRNIGVTGVLNTLVGTAPSGGWIGSVPGQTTDALPASGTARLDVTYGLVSADGAAVTDTIARFLGAERHIQVTQSGGQITSIHVMAPPFARNTIVRVQGDALIVGMQEVPELRVYGLDGALRRIVRTGTALTPVTQEHIDRVIAHAVAGVAEPLATSVRRNLTELADTKFLPPYGTFLLDRAGNIWLQDHPALQDGPRWTVFNSSGVLLARLALPDRFTPYDIGPDWIAGRELDELEVEHVRVYRFTRRD